MPCPHCLVVIGIRILLVSHKLLDVDDIDVVIYECNLKPLCPSLPHVHCNINIIIYNLLLNTSLRLPDLGFKAVHNILIFPKVI